MQEFFCLFATSGIALSRPIHESQNARILLFLFPTPPLHAVLMREIPKVALLIETARGFGRDFLSGVARYARLHGPWSFHITPGDFKQAIPKMKQWGGTGIIARIPDERFAHAILEAGLPTVAVGLSDEQLRPDNPLSKLPEVSPIESEVVRLVIEHLMVRGFRRYAFVGLEDRSWSNRREAAYIEQLDKVGIEPHIYHSPKRSADRVWEKEQNILADWISRLPMPIGLFGCNDDRGREVLEACSLAGLPCPKTWRSWASTTTKSSASWPIRRCPAWL